MHYNGLATRPEPTGVVDDASGRDTAHHDHVSFEALERPETYMIMGKAGSASLRPK
jgi:hypothetical protein